MKTAARLLTLAFLVTALLGTAQAEPARAPNAWAKAKSALARPGVAFKKWKAAHKARVSARKASFAKKYKAVRLPGGTPYGFAGGAYYLVTPRVNMDLIKSAQKPRPTAPKKTEPPLRMLPGGAPYGFAGNIYVR
jgi:hypothetical protein